MDIEFTHTIPGTSPTFVPTIPCPKCKGTGMLESTYNPVFTNGALLRQRRTCDRCGGAGRVVAT